MENTDNQLGTDELISKWKETDPNLVDLVGLRKFVESSVTGSDEVTR